MLRSCPLKLDALASQWLVLDADVDQAEKQARIAKARGVGLKWYYAEPGAADEARRRFYDEGIQGIVIATMPPKRRP